MGTATAILVTIAAEGALSTIADIRAGAVAMLLGPPDWSPANLSFQSSSDGVTFVDLYDADGSEARVAMGANRAVLMPVELTQGLAYLRLRSGPARQPVAQAADRQFTLMVV